MKRSPILSAFLIPIIVACATAPAKYEFNPVANINDDYDAVWAAIIEYFAVGNLPIETIEKDSGLIVTGWMDASGDTYGEEDKIFCDCGESDFLTSVRWSRGKFSIFVKKINESSTDMRVTCTFQQGRFSDDYFTVTCNSTGGLELMLHDYVRAKTRGIVGPSPPAFKPGHVD